MATGPIRRRSPTAVVEMARNGRFAEIEELFAAAAAGGGVR